MQAVLKINKNYLICVFTAALLSLLLTTHSHAEIFQCLDSKGKKIYTDNKSLCKDLKNTTVLKENKTEEKKATVNYRLPKRFYDQVGEKYSIYIEQDLLKGNQELAKAATLKLESSLSAVFSTLPATPANRLKKLHFYLLWGTDSPNGGRNSGMVYFRKGKPLDHPNLDPLWDNVIVIYSATNFMYLDPLWTKKALMHELAHAWHLNNWKQQHPPIIEAYQNAKENKLYRDVTDYKNRKISEAYAIKNHLEYFAELSAVYFVGGNYFPNNRQELENYDSVGAKLIMDSWLNTTAVARNQP